MDEDMSMYEDENDYTETPGLFDRIKIPGAIILIAAAAVTGGVVFYKKKKKAKEQDIDETV